MLPFNILRTRVYCIRSLQLEQNQCCDNHVHEQQHNVPHGLYIWYLISVELISKCIHLDDRHYFGTLWQITYLHASKVWCDCTSSFLDDERISVENYFKKNHIYK